MTDCPGVECFTQESGEPPLTEKGIALLVDRFYIKVRQDALLDPVFARAIGEDDWPEHLATMRDFWSSVMLTSGRYHGNPVAAHRRHDGIKPAHFERWLALFGKPAGNCSATKSQRRSGTKRTASPRACNSRCSTGPRTTCGRRSARAPAATSDAPRRSSR